MLHLSDVHHELLPYMKPAEVKSRNLILESWVEGIERIPYHSNQ